MRIVARAIRARTHATLVRPVRTYCTVRRAIVAPARLLSTITSAYPLGHRPARTSYRLLVHLPALGILRTVAAAPWARIARAAATPRACQIIRHVTFPVGVLMVYGGSPPHVRTLRIRTLGLHAARPMVCPLPAPAAAARAYSSFFLRGTLYRLRTAGSFVSALWMAAISATWPSTPLLASHVL